MARRFHTKVVGRSQQADIQINNGSVSRFHLEVTSTESGRYFLIDRASTSGTWCFRKNEWKRIEREYVEATETIALGKFKITLLELLRL